MAPGRFDWNFKLFMLFLVIGGWDIFSEIALRWKSKGLTDDKSILGQVMLGAVRQQAITWANVDPDLCRHMVSLGPNDWGLDPL